MKETIELKGVPYDNIEVITDRYGITRMTLHAWQKDNLVPKPIKLGRRVFYNRTAVEDYLLNSNR